MSFYVIVTDPEGAQQGYAGPFVPVTTRMQVNGDGTVHGFDNLARKFPNRPQAIDFLRQLANKPDGTFGRFTWKRE
jgi:hypothetical protein